MQSEHVTTPFGRRPMSLGMLLTQHRAHEIAPDQSIDKWKIFRTLCEARSLLDVSDRALAVLNALLSFYPGNMLSAENGLVVFPSNTQLSIRAHGIAPATLRRHLAALVEAGLLLRKDSPNGKRYVRRSTKGEIDQAYGFSIAPLIARAAEFQMLAAGIIANREQLSATKERMTLCRRDISKLLAAAATEGLTGDWETFRGQYEAIVGSIPRAPTVHHLLPVLENLEALRQRILNSLEENANLRIMGTNEAHSDRHIEESYPESIFESERQSENQDDMDSDELSKKPDSVRKPDHSVTHLPLDIILRACPEIRNYGPGGAIATWRDLMMAAIVIRSMLGVSPAAYESACAVIGPENTAVVMACLLERAEHIASAGGYLRDLTKRAERCEFTVNPMVMALFRARSGEKAMLN